MTTTDNTLPDDRQAPPVDTGAAKRLTAAMATHFPREEIDLDDVSEVLALLAAVREACAALEAEATAQRVAAKEARMLAAARFAVSLPSEEAIASACSTVGPSIGEGGMHAYDAAVACVREVLEGVRLVRSRSEDLDDWQVVATGETVIREGHSAALNAAPPAAVQAEPKTIEQMRSDFEWWWVTRGVFPPIGSPECGAAFSAWIASGGYTAPGGWKVSPRPWGYEAALAARPAPAADAEPVAWMYTNTGRGDVVIDTAKPDADETVAWEYTRPAAPLSEDKAARPPALTLTAHQLGQLLEFATGEPYLTLEADVASTVISVAERSDVRDEAGALPAGLFCWLTDYPEEGYHGPLEALPVDEVEPEAPRQAAVFEVVDGGVVPVSGAGVDDVVTLGLLVGYDFSDEAAAALSQERRDEFAAWASAAHLAASDNAVDVPERPEWLPDPWQGPTDCRTIDSISSPTPINLEG